jgi:hypothetical protein
MGAAWAVAAIALAGATFMLRFLIALLREGAPSVCYWVPVRRESENEVRLTGLRGIYLDDDCSTDSDRSADYVELLENKDYAEEESSSGLIALDARAVSNGFAWRSIHPRRGSVFRENRL